MPGAERAALTDGHVQELARAILERPQYKNFRIESYELWSLLGDRWRALMDWLLQLHESDPGSYWLLVGCLALICLALVLHIAWTVRRALQSVPRPLPREQHRAEQDFAGEASVLAGRGEHLEAAHRLLLASLRSLAQRRLIPLRPEDGNHAVCQRLRASSLPVALRGQLIALILETDRAWFGSRAGAAEAPADLYVRWSRAYAQLSALCVHEVGAP